MLHESLMALPRMAVATLLAEVHLCIIENRVHVIWARYRDGPAANDPSSASGLRAAHQHGERAPAQGMAARDRLPDRGGSVSEIGAGLPEAIARRHQGLVREPVVEREHGRHHLPPR